MEKESGSTLKKWWDLLIGDSASSISQRVSSPWVIKPEIGSLTMARSTTMWNCERSWGPIFSGRDQTLKSFCMRTANGGWSALTIYVECLLLPYGMRVSTLCCAHE